MKIDPTIDLTDAEKYLSHFWEPLTGHKVSYQGEIFTVKNIIGDQLVLNECDKLLWIQDVGWKPTLDNCDDIIVRFYATLIDNGQQIMFKKDGQTCYFKRPDTLEDYVEVIRQLRVLIKFEKRT